VVYLGEIEKRKALTMVLETKNEMETSAVGEKLAEKLNPGDVIALYGDLGAGKTAFVRGLAKGLGLSARVSSPTFTIVNEYLGDVPLFHFDMYRLGDADELFEIGWEDYLERGGVCAVEWSENVPGAFPDDHIIVNITKTGDNSRSIEIVRNGGAEV
jgi:tRNA threonylcarbamoyladenosine biosynthesis protein TsaE